MGSRSGYYLSLLLGLSLGIALGALHLASVGHSRADSAEAAMSVIDGDTVQLAGRVIQLYGIDAPELGQRCLEDGEWIHCGLLAAFELNKLIGVGRGPIDCTPPRGGGHGPSRICTVGHIDLAHALLVAGYVVAAPDTSPGYLAAEDSARQGALGLWHMQFTGPADWLREERLAEEPGLEQGECPIKAVLGQTGARLYLVPTDPAYQATAVDPKRGERYFCSDEDAREAGWRRPDERPGPAGTG